MKFIGFLTRARSVVWNCLAENFQTHIFLLLLFNRMTIKAKTKVLVSAQVGFFIFYFFFLAFSDSISLFARTVKLDFSSAAPELLMVGEPYGG